MQLRSIAPALPYRLAFAPDELSFRTDGVDRKVKNRNLFTEREMLAAVKLGVDEPAIVLAVLGYRGVMQDYLLRLGMAFGKLSTNPNSGVTGEDIRKYIEYAEAWNSQNFTENFLPAIAVYLEQAKRDNPDQPTHSLINQELFGNAMKFLIDNGAYRNWVTTPESVDPSRPVRHFLCPGLAPIRDQVGDGNVLYRMYELAASKLTGGDPAATSLASSVRSMAEQTLRVYEQLPASRKRAAKDDNSSQE